MPLSHMYHVFDTVMKPSIPTHSYTHPLIPHIYTLTHTHHTVVSQVFYCSYRHDQLHTFASTKLDRAVCERYSRGSREARGNSLALNIWNTSLCGERGRKRREIQVGKRYRRRRDTGGERREGREGRGAKWGGMTEVKSSEFNC